MCENDSTNFEYKEIKLLDLQSIQSRLPKSVMDRRMEKD